MLNTAQNKKLEVYASEYIKELTDADLQSLVKYVIQSSKSVLDIGCGIGDYLKYTSPDIKVTAVEPHLPYLEIAKEKTPWVSFHNTDGISFLSNTGEKFDCILLIDVVEHLGEEESIRLVNLAAEHSSKIVFAQIPIGHHEQDGDVWNLGGEYWQTHRSTWTQKNIDKLGFSYVEIWKDWYEWGEDIQKSRDTSIALWIKDYDERNLASLFEGYSGKLENENYEKWRTAFEKDGYKSNMGDHSTYFYNRYLEEIGLYYCLEKADRIAEYGSGDGIFMKKFIEIRPGKRFYLCEISDKAVENLKLNFNKYENVEILLNYPELKNLKKIDLAFSFLMCQSMPAALWAKHLSCVKKMLSDGGSYIFQFANHPEGIADNIVANAIAGSNKYKPDEIYQMLEEAGFKNCNITEPIKLENFNTDILWYLCRAY